jgi:hypothetical protein
MQKQLKVYSGVLWIRSAALLSLFILFGFQSAHAQSAVQLSPQINFFNPAPQVFFTNKLSVNYTSGQVILASTADGTGSISTDDQVTITVTRANGTTAEYDFIFGRPNNNGLPLTVSPQNVTFLFQPGANTVSIVCRNNFAGAFSTGFFLVGALSIIPSQCEQDLTISMQQIQTLLTQNNQLQAQVNSLTEQNSTLQNQLTMANNAILNLNNGLANGSTTIIQNIQQATGDPEFTIPGATPLTQFQTLVEAILVLEQDSKKDLYDKILFPFLGTTRKKR